MSMLSAQMDELRKLAGDGSMEWVAGPIRTSILLRAADTIWELRDDLQRANAENAKLHQQLADVTESIGRVEERCAKLREVISDGEESARLILDESRALQSENDKLQNDADLLRAMLSQERTEKQHYMAESACLREMCRDMLHDAMENVCSKAHWCDEKNWQTCNDKECGNRLYVEMARKLGVEVDDGTE